MQEPKPKRTFRFRRVLYWLLGMYAFLALIVFLFGDNLVFFPDKGGDFTLPKDAEDVYFGNPKLHAWYLKHPKARFTVIVCHGNAGNISGRDDIYEQLRATGVNVFAFDYRGYGKSEGSPTEDGMYEDAVAAWEAVVKRGVKPEQIVVLGQSLGSAAATYLASKRKCAGLILEAPMVSAPRMASRVVPFPPLGWALRVRLDNLERIGKVSCPLLVVHGTADSVIPFEQGKEVFQAAKEPKRFLPLKGGDHNDLWDGRTEEYLNGIKRFLADLEQSLN